MGSFYNGVISVSLFGESHGEVIGVTIDNLAPGIKLDMDFIQGQVNRRKAKGKISTQRRENDDFFIVSGYFNGYTTGTPLTVLIKNSEMNSKDYSKIKDLLRPSHADYTAYEKYLGYQDYRGGGHFSGRITAPLVIAGSICQSILRSKGIYIGTHILELDGIFDSLFDKDNSISQIDNLLKSDFPTIDLSVGEKMQEAIENYQKNQNSVGGILQSCIYNMPCGIGEPFFHSLESELSSLLFSVPAVKGVEFGMGFDFKNHSGFDANDELYMDNGKIRTKTNNNGGINGGISNGMPILIQTAVKPTASIFKEQNTVNYKTKTDEKICIEGRHDPAVIHRASVVVDSVLAIGVLNSICTRYGYMWMADEVI